MWCKGRRARCKSVRSGWRRRIYEAGGAAYCERRASEGSTGIGNGLSLEQYDQKNFGFLRLEVGKSQIVGTYRSAPYVTGVTPSGSVLDSFVIDLGKHTVTTLGSGSATTKGSKAPQTSNKEALN